MPGPSGTFVADIHVHSRYSRATSRDLDLEHLWVWAQRKGVRVVGTGDFTHPGWFAELERKLSPEENGLYSLRDPGEELRRHVPPSCAGPVQFMLTVEISSIYKRDGRTRKVHNVVCVPDLQTAAALNRALARIGNIQSDGRPILGLDSRDLLEMVLSISPRAVLIPAHIWTPWFSALGSKSGFDSIEACFADLADHIFAVETGLSSDPPMNWRVSALDRYALISNSDAHSPSKLARECNLFSCEPSFDGIFAALRDPEHVGFEGTVEFFPDEGKYHLDGHRKCSQRMTPAQTRVRGGRCPVCGRPVTVGVLYRVEELADRSEDERPAGRPGFVSLIGFAEVVGEVLGGRGPGTKGVARVVDRCQRELGCELTILRDVPVEDLERVGGPVLAEAVRRMRAGEVRIEGGYDGEFGTIHLLESHERRRLRGQTALFEIAALEEPAPPSADEVSDAYAYEVDPEEDRTLDGPLFGGPLSPLAPKRRRKGRRVLSPLLEGLSGEQRRAAMHTGSPVLIWAGPGTGKTRTLTRRVALRVEQGLDPGRILAVTFTTRAAAEMRGRLEQLLGAETAACIRVCTFHALALAVLNEHRRREGQEPVRILDEAEQLVLLARLHPDLSPRKLDRQQRLCGLALLGLADPAPDWLDDYRALLEEEQALDLDSLVPAAVDLLLREPELLASWRERCAVTCVDEYQDVNHAQYELVRLLAGDGSDLCVIGDADQSIYGFRGADPRYFLRFRDDYPGARLLTLERSYRTASALLRAAVQVIRHNPGRDDSWHNWSTAEGATRVTFYRAPSAAAEAEYIVHSVERLLGGHTFFSVDSGRTVGAEDHVAAVGELSFRDIAVLFRTRRQLDLLQEALDRSGIPYRCAKGRRPLDPVLGFLGRVIEGESGEGPNSEVELAARASELEPRDGLRLLVQELCDPGERDVASELTDVMAAQLYGVRSWMPMARSLCATAFLEADRVRGQAEAVSVMTLHASKGLEFKAVFIVGCEEGLLPHILPGEEHDAERIAEERRLLYVGMTRAERLLVLTHAARRPARGLIEERTPSRFLSEVEATLVHQVTPDRRPRRRAPQLDLF
jgi:DNA helicase-2/ATP-dependent DNA helicase PcrA